MVEIALLERERERERERDFYQMIFLRFIEKLFADPSNARKILIICFF